MHKNTVAVLDEAQERILSLHEYVHEYVDISSLEEAAEMLLRLKDLRDDFRLMFDSCSAAIMLKMGDLREIPVDGMVLERKTGTTRKKWRHDELVVKMMQRLKQLSIDEDTGEVTLTPDQVAEAFMKYGHVDYWRVGNLKTIDINPDAFSDTEEGKESLAIKRNN